MIQRKQSLYFLLAALFNMCLFFMDIYRADGYNMQINSPGNYLLLIVAVITIALPLIAIFMYKKRKDQRNLGFLGIVANVVFIALMLWMISRVSAVPNPPLNGHYWFGSIMPALSVIFIVMALNGIRKDEKLVRSQDRLR